MNLRPLGLAQSLTLSAAAVEVAVAATAIDGEGILLADMFWSDGWSAMKDGTEQNRTPKLRITNTHNSIWSLTIFSLAFSPFAMNATLRLRPN